MNFGFLKRIWHIRGQLPLPDGQSAEEALIRLSPLFEKAGTSYEVSGPELHFTKTEQAAQDKMSIYDGGTLLIDETATPAILTYRLKSRALLACFIAPLIFLAFAQFAVAVSALHTSADASDRATERGADADEDKAEEDEEKKVRKLNPIDKFLGAPAPKQPDDDKACDVEAEGETAIRRSSEPRTATRREGEPSEKQAECETKDKKKKPKHSPTPAYVFAGIFFVVYLAGRFLEQWLIKRAFREKLEGAEG